VAVSSVSRQISQLEAELGVALIEHGRRAIMLTDAGRLLVEYYAQQQGLREGFEARLSDLKGLRAGRIVLAIGEGFVGMTLSGLVARFIAKHQGIAVDIQMSASSSEIVRLVVEDVAHLGLAFQSSEDPRIRVLASARHPLCAIVRPTHALAGNSTITLGELCAHPMCLPEGSFRTRQLLKAAESAEGLTLQPVVTSNSVVMLKSLLLSIPLLTVLPQLAVAGEIERGELVAVPIESAALQNTSVHLIGRLGRQLTPAPLRLMSALLAYLNRYEHSGLVSGSTPRLEESPGTGG
jgi:DNA-binding transcriptional LysR family regulator